MWYNRCAEILQRDNYRCVCGNRAAHVHHIAPRAWFGKKGQELCWHPKNLISLCVNCHSDMAHTKKRRKQYLELLCEKYGYDYEGKVWQRILGV